MYLFKALPTMLAVSRIRTFKNYNKKLKNFNGNKRSGIIKAILMKKNKAERIKLPDLSNNTKLQ